MHHGGIGVHGSAIAPKYDGKSHNHLVLVSHKLHHVSEDSASHGCEGCKKDQISKCHLHLIAIGRRALLISTARSMLKKLHV